MSSISGLLSSLASDPYAKYGNLFSSGSGGVFDVAQAQKNASTQANQLMEAFKANKGEVTTLKKETANYLDQYAAGMKTLSQEAGKLKNQGLDKILYNKDGAVTDETAAATVKATQSMVDAYNSTLKLLNDNADRGPGTMKQLARMAGDPAPAQGLKLVGISVNDDGTLALDAEKMTEALKTTDPNQLDLYKDILSGYGGLADSVNKRANFGADMNARDLISNDLANIQSKQSENPFRELYYGMKGNVFAMSNQAVTGMLMNLMV